MHTIDFFTKIKSNKLRLLSKTETKDSKAKKSMHFNNSLPPKMYFLHKAQKWAFKLEGKEPVNGSGSRNISFVDKLKTEEISP